MSGGPWVAALFLGCGGPPDPCDPMAGPEQVLASAQGHDLTCGDVVHVRGAVTLLAGRPLQPRAEDSLRRAVGDRFESDPAGTAVWLAEVMAVSDSLWGGQGLEGAEKRSVEAWRAHRGTGPLAESDPYVGNIVREALSVWTTADADQWVLTEMDIEGWIAYASLCREAQNGGPLRLSVSDRVQLYRALGERFDTGDREDRRALISVGPYWRNVAARWKEGSYEDQRRWIDAAPLPPPMTASSLAYADAIIQGDLRRHAQVLHEALGPFSMRGAP